MRVQAERDRHAVVALPVASSCDKLAGLLAVPSGQGVVPSGQGVLVVILVFVFLVLNAMV
jgi:hypothetical protein